MHPTAALMFANGHIADLYAEGERERLAEEFRRTAVPATNWVAGLIGTVVLRLRSRGHRLRDAGRALPRAAAR